MVHSMVHAYGKMSLPHVRTESLAQFLIRPTTANKPCAFRLCFTTSASDAVKAQPQKPVPILAATLLSPPPPPPRPPSCTLQPPALKYLFPPGPHAPSFPPCLLPPGQTSTCPSACSPVYLSLSNAKLAFGLIANEGQIPALPDRQLNAVYLGSRLDIHVLHV